MSGAGRRPIVAGNWKMHGTRAFAVGLAAGVREAVAGHAVDVVLCPPFVWLDAVGRALGGSPVALGAQDVHHESEGAFTGAVSAAMLRDLGCVYCIVGHSERRALFGETDETVARKAAALLDAGIRPIVCVGETLAEREAGRTETVVEGQVRRSLDGLADRLDGVVMAYEPVWAIGTGRTAGVAQAQEVHGLIRAVVADLAGATVAGALRIQYGGSVKPSNAAELFAGVDVDGGLIGGASLDAGPFAAIVAAAG